MIQKIRFSKNDIIDTGYRIYNGDCIDVFKTISLLLLLLCMVNVNAEIYKWTDEKGKIHFSDKKPAELKSEKLQLRINTYESISYEASIFNVGKKVVLYSTDWCGYCKKAKKYFARKGISFTEYDIEKNAKARRQYKKMGAKGVPVILVGNKRMNGFNEKAFEKMYN